jgi:prephenate dehydrogenase
LTAANADLYQGALCVVTPTPRSRPEAVRSVAALWCSVGARILEMEPAEHDRAAASISHVPHLIAALLVELAARGNAEARQLCAGGFRDTTRIASGSADLWTGILASNRAEVIGALRNFSDSVEEAIEIMEKNDTASLQTLLARAAANRAEMLSVP